MKRRVGSYTAAHNQSKFRPRLAVLGNFTGRISELWVLVSSKIQIHDRCANLFSQPALSAIPREHMTQMGDFMLKLQLTEFLRPEEVDTIRLALAKVKTKHRVSGVSEALRMRRFSESLLFFARDEVLAAWLYFRLPSIHRLLAYAAM